MPTTEAMYAEADRALDRMTRYAKRQLVRAYRESLDRVRLEIADMYELHAAQGKLTYAEMQKYGRLTKLEGEIGRELTRLGIKTRNLMHRALGELFEESYYRALWATEMSSGVAIGFGILNPKLIEASIMNPIAGLTLNEILQRNRQQIIWKVKQEITQGLIRGEGYDKMARRLREVFLGDAVKATRVVQTEAHRVQNEARYAAGQEAAAAGVVTKKRWVATLDDRTRDTHQALDGQEVLPDGLFTSPSGAKAPHPGAFGVPAEDINCRCKHIWVVAGLEPKLRRAKEDGIIPYMTYKQWREWRKTRHG